jgi:ADP-ribosylglycohydrolase
MVLLGHATGDAYGVPYELGSKPVPRFKPPEMLGGGLGGYKPGEYSDDTQMAVALANALTFYDARTEKGLDLVAEKFLWWRKDGATDIGGQTSSVLSTSRQRHGTETRVRTVAPAHDVPRGWFRRAVLRQAPLHVPAVTENVPASLSVIMTDVSRGFHQRTGRSAGNGALMRTSPVALAYLRDRYACAEAARKVGTLTHWDTDSGDACVLWCEAIRVAVLDGMPEVTMQSVYNLVTGALDLIPDDRRAIWAGRISEASVKFPGDFPNNGWVVTAFQAALSSVFMSADVRNPEDPSKRFLAGVYAAVRAGGDTDTVAAIAGGMLGAVHGEIPQEVLSQVNGWPGMDHISLSALADEVVSAHESW